MDLKNIDNLFFLFDKVRNEYHCNINDEIIIYGKWCDSGIKNNHSISQVKTKQWVIFAIKINTKYVDNFVELADEKNSVYNVLKWGTFKVIIDYNQFNFNC
jgi:hypothetical protein